MLFVTLYEQLKSFWGRIWVCMCGTYLLFESTNGRVREDDYCDTTRGGSVLYHHSQAVQQINAPDEHR